MSLMKKKSALSLLNKMAIVEVSARGNEIEWIYVENSEENWSTLRKIGFSDEEINNSIFDCEAEEDVIDLNNLVWGLAEWFDGTTFFSEVPAGY